MRCRTMGVVNVTPDSFVGEVRTPGADAAVARARQLLDEGADIIDIGGESTRPGATEISADEELARVLPVVRAVVQQSAGAVEVSIDTRNETVARAAVAAGATIINDMSAQLGHIAGELGVGYVAAHMQGTPATMQLAPRYDDVVEQVLTSMTNAAQNALAAGATTVWIDPGIGFGKTYEHNLDLLANLDRLVATGHPVLVGVSRKGMLGRIHAASDGGEPVDLAALDRVRSTPTDDRLDASLALAAWCAQLGVDVVRVHDVAETVAAMNVVQPSQRM